jgi:CcmD family protein
MTLASLLHAAAVAAPATGRTPGQFVPVSGGGETTSATTLLVAAYLIMWALLILFIYFSWRRQQRIESRVDHLETALAKVDSETQNKS